MPIIGKGIMPSEEFATMLTDAIKEEERIVIKTTIGRAVWSWLMHKIAADQPPKELITKIYKSSPMIDALINRANYKEPTLNPDENSRAEDSADPGQASSKP